MELFDESAPTVDFIHIESVCETEDWIRGLESFYWFFQSTGGTMYRVQPDSVAEVILNVFLPVQRLFQGLIGFVPTRYAAQQLTFQDATACQNNTMRVMASVIQAPLCVIISDLRWTLV